MKLVRWGKVGVYFLTPPIPLFDWKYCNGILVRGNDGSVTEPARLWRTHLTQKENCTKGFMQAVSLYV